MYNFLFFLPCANARMRLIRTIQYSVMFTALLQLAFFDVSPDLEEYIEENNQRDYIYTILWSKNHVPL